MSPTLRAVRVLLLALTATTSLIGHAQAQTTHSTLDASASRPRFGWGEMIWVTTVDGRERQGRIVSSSSVELQLQAAGGSDTIQWADVAAISKADPVGDGMLKGAFAGALAAGLPAVVFISNYGECPCGSRALGFVVGHAALGAGIGLAVGAALDSLSAERRTVYRSGKTITVAPVVAPGRLAVGGSVSW
jgi:hypothetical protein